MIIEIVVYSIESALEAQKGGADRVELCANPGDGGTTPSVGIIQQVRKNLSIEVYVMIRPRGEDFLYTDEEFASMKRDIEMCKQLGVEGVVFGILRKDGSIDKEKCAHLISLARPMKVTCHRAFDVTCDPLQALEDCIEIGFDRILTSGQQPKAIQGVALITQLILKANGRIKIMPGSGIVEENVQEIVTKTHAQEIHFSAIAHRKSKMEFSNSSIKGMGSAQNTESMVRTVDADLIRRMRSIVEN
jgi:copper homeostasis protein